MKETIDRLRTEGAERIRAANSATEIEAARVALLGRKGDVTGLLRGLKDVAADQRPAMGAELNRLKEELVALLEARETEVSGQDTASVATYDLTLPGTPPTAAGTTHPLVSVLESICDIFYGMGFGRGDGPEVELDYYNFTALNFPDDHPARDIQDTFYINEKVCLRTQTSPLFLMSTSQFTGLPTDPIFCFVGSHERDMGIPFQNGQNTSESR